MHFHYLTKTLNVQGVMKFTVLVKPIFISSFIINLYQWSISTICPEAKKIFQRNLAVWIHLNINMVICLSWRTRLPQVVKLNNLEEGFPCLSSLYTCSFNCTAQYILIRMTIRLNYYNPTHWNLTYNTCPTKRILA